jgi:hypothetical protein
MSEMKEDDVWSHPITVRLLDLLDDLKTTNKPFPDDDPSKTKEERRKAYELWAVGVQQFTLEVCLTTPQEWTVKLDDWANEIRQWAQGATHSFAMIEAASNSTRVKYTIYVWRESKPSKNEIG